MSIHTFHGNFFVRSTDLLSLANVNPDSGFAVQVSIDENLADTSLACFQAALLYTSSKGIVCVCVWDSKRGGQTEKKGGGVKSTRGTERDAGTQGRRKEVFLKLTKQTIFRICFNCERYCSILKFSTWVLHRSHVTSQCCYTVPDMNS